MVNCFEELAVIVSSVQVGTPVTSLQSPAVLTSVTPAGRVSVTTTSVASDGPALLTVTV